MEKVKKAVESFDQMIKDASKDINDAGACYVRYCACFTSEEYDIIEGFNEDFKNNGNDITKVFADKSKYTDKVINVIQKFIRFSENKFTYFNHEFLERFDRIVRHAREGRIYARHCVFLYTDMFTAEERNLIDDFKTALNNNDNMIKVFREMAYTDEQIFVIDRFVGFVEGLPVFRFTGWLRWFFSRRRVARKREMEKRREKVREIELLESVRKNGLITELDYQLQLKKLDEKYN